MVRNSGADSQNASLGDINPALKSFSSVSSSYRV